MSLATLILTVVAILVFFGLAERVLDRMYLTDRGALLLVAAMFIGTLLPNVVIGPVEINIGGALIPTGICIWLLIRADSWQERLRALAGVLVTAGIVYALSVWLPDEPEKLPIEPILLYGLAGGSVSWILGRSRRGAFVCGVLGVILADIANALVIRQAGVHQPLILGGAGLADAVVVSGVLAVLISELVGETMERLTRGNRRKRGDDA